jgi:Flp pilus assembly protein TadG
MSKARWPQRKDSRKEHGSIMVMSAIGMLSMLLAVGLGVDISRFYLAKTELQNSADAAALAGASALNSTSYGIDEAVFRATQEIKNKYDFNNTDVSLLSSNVLFAANLNDDPYMNAASARASAASIRYVRVTTPPSAIGVSFAKMVLGDSKNLSATATAGLSVPLNLFCNFIPLSVIDTDPVKMVPGQIYTIRASTSNSPSPGNYQILAVAGPGGIDVGFGIGSGVDACAAANATYTLDTKPGLTAGKVRTGINSRFDDYAGSQLSPVDQPPDTNIKEGITHTQYLAGRATMNDPTIYQAPSAADLNYAVPDRRVVLIPIVELAQYNQGRNTVTFDRFGAFFLRTKAGSGNSGDIQAEYLSDAVAVGKGGYDPNGAVGNPLIRTPVLYK